MDGPGYAGRSIGAFLEALGDEEPAPGGGTAAATTIAFAAALVAMVARNSQESWEDARAVAAQAIKLQGRALVLAEDDARAWDDALRALRGTNVGEADRAGALEQKLERSAEVPVAIAEAGADVALLAAQAAERGDGTFRGDAGAAAVLAQAGARAAVRLVAVNLATRDDDPRLGRARRSEELAAAATARALDAGP